MGSNSFFGKSKSAGLKARGGSSVGSDKEMNGKLRRPKLRRPIKLNEYGLKRIPDYTELAYKEAVSKLRYFLSGNYVPSVRSYGSPSIKNLDESDCEERKYSPGGYALTEFKSRPKLTAKYATLYADSLTNAYTPNVPVAVAPPSVVAPADVSSGTNPDVINFIQKQEEYIEQLERESQYCRDELNNLLGKVKEVISENEHLHEAQKNKLISRMFHSYNGGSETDDLDDLGDSTGLDSDNKVSPTKGRKSAKFRSEGRKLEGPNIVFESRIAELEAQLAQAKIDLRKVQEENNDNKRKLASGLVDSTCLDGFKRQIDNLQRDKNALEAQISKLKLTLEQRDGDDKYRRGSDIVEMQLREERNSLEAEVRRLKEDLANERGKVREMAGEGARRAIQERSAAEQRYNAHFDELQHDLAAQYDTVAKLQLELDRQRREENDLKRELSLKSSAVEELKTELKSKSGSLQADLAQAYAEKASLEEELASARLAIERLQRQAKHEANRLNSEIQSLRQRLDRADADLVHSRRENLRLSEQISNLEKEINMKNLTPSSPPEKKKEKELSSMLESMENKHTKTVAELESMIQSQNSLMEKLTGDCRLLTDKLDDASRRHKEELAALHRQVNSLGRSLQPTQHAPSAYQAPPTHTTAASRHVPVTPAGARPVYPGSDTTGLAQIRRPSVSGFQHNSDNSPASRTVSRQSSIQSIKSNAPTSNYQQKQYLHEPISNNSMEIEDHKKEDSLNTEVNQQYQSQEYGDDTREKSEHNQAPMKDEYDHSKSGDSQYEQYQARSQEDPRIHAQDQIADNAEYAQSQIADNTECAQSQIGDNAGYESEVADSVLYQKREKAEYEPEVADKTNTQYGQSHDETESAQYDQTHSTNYDQADPNYQGYDSQQYEQSYPQEYENYDQYQQQYTDPNVQYQDQYQYPSEGQYQGDQYNTEYPPQPQEFQPQQPELQAVETKSAMERTDSKRSNSPRDIAQS